MLFFRVAEGCSSSTRATSPRSALDAASIGDEDARTGAGGPHRGAVPVAVAPARLVRAVAVLRVPRSGVFPTVARPAARGKDVTGRAWALARACTCLSTLSVATTDCDDLVTEDTTVVGLATPIAVSPTASATAASRGPTSGISNTAVATPTSGEGGAP